MDKVKDLNPNGMVVYFQDGSKFFNKSTWGFVVSKLKSESYQEISKHFMNYLMPRKQKFYLNKFGMRLFAKVVKLESVDLSLWFYRTFVEAMKKVRSPVKKNEFHYSHILLGSSLKLSRQ